MHQKGLITGVGVYGPFEDDKGTAREGRTVPYVEFVAADGSGTYRPTLGEGVEAPALFAQGEAQLEVAVARSGKLSLRLVGFKAEGQALKAAA
jgi:hypothetical protein